MPKDYALFLSSVVQLYETLAVDMGAVAPLRHSVLELDRLESGATFATAEASRSRGRHIYLCPPKGGCRGAHYSRCASAAYGYYLVLAVAGHKAVSDVAIGDHDTRHCGAHGISFQCSLQQRETAPWRKPGCAKPPERERCPLWSSDAVLPCCFVAVDHMRRSVVVSVRGQLR